MTTVLTDQAVRRVPATAAEACRVVGATPAEVLAAVSATGDGHAYLVGSLAVGLGDGHADIDVHVVSTDDHPAGGPVLAFTPGGVCVDIRQLHRSDLDRVLGRVLGGHPDHCARPAGRTASWLASRWLNALPLDGCAPPLLTGEQRALAGGLLVSSLLADLTALVAFAVLAEHAGAGRAWYLCRRAGTAAWELAACLAGENYLGARWLPARSRHPRVAALAAVACGASSGADLDRVLGGLGLTRWGLLARVHLRTNPEAERWTLGGRSLLLVGGRRLVPRVAPLPATVAAAIGHDPAAVFAGLAGGALRWTVDVTGITPTLESMP